MSKTNSGASQSSFTKKRIANKKLTLFASTFVSFLINLFLVIVLATNSIEFKYLIFPILICVLDAVFLFVSINTNFKFSYSNLYIALYAVIFVLVSAAYAAILLNLLNGMQSVAITTISFLCWAVLSGVTVIVTLICALKASARKHTLSMILSVITLIVCVGGYAFNITNVGFFGQGADTIERPATFTYDEKAGYFIADGVINGKGGKVVIPETFNGVKVGAVDCAIFNAKDVSSIVLNSADITFKNVAALQADNTTKLMAGKDDLPGLLEDLYSQAVNNTAAAPNIIALAAAVAPSDLAADEVCIIFRYDAEALKHAGGKYMPLWIGKQGDTFTLSYESGISYVDETKTKDESLLASLYNAGSNGGGYVLSALTDTDGNAIVGKKITESATVDVSFDKVYRIEVRPDNDSLYELSDSFRFLSTATDALKYRFVTLETAADLLSTVDTRESLALAWEYAYPLTDRSTLEVDLPALLAANSGDSVMLYPGWTLQNPTIESCTTADTNTALTYGDNLTILTTATAPSGGYVLRYVWTMNGVTVAETQSFDISKVRMTEAGTYTVTVTAYSDTLSSLTSTAVASVDITVAKKRLPINWTPFENDEYERVYTALSTTIECTEDATALVYPDEDTITFAYSTESIKNAGSYAITVALTGDCANKYYIEDASLSKTYTIARKELTLSWSGDTFTYNGADQKPTVSIADGICGSDTVTVSATAGFDAGDHTSAASLGGTHSANYAIKTEEATFAFKINPKPITPTFTNLSQVYSKENLKPKVSFTGLVGMDDPAYTLKVNNEAAGQIAAGSYTAVVSIANPNYVLSVDNTGYTLDDTTGAVSTTFTITKRPLHLYFSDTEQIYNNRKLNPSVTFTDILDGDEVLPTLLLDGASTQTNAGEYTATVTITNPNYVLDPTGTSYAQDPETGAVYTDFIISPKEITPVFKNTTLEYNGQEQKPTVSFNGTITGTDPQYTLTVDGATGQINAKTYLAAVTIANPNYVLAMNSDTATFEITVKQISAEFGNTSPIYNGQYQKPSVTFTGVMGEDDVNYTIKVDNSKDGAKNAGEYDAVVSIANPNYVLKEDTIQCDFVINPAPLELKWENLEFTYDKTTKTPKATFATTADKIYDSLSITVTGGQINANTDTDYYATASVNNPNYTITNPKEKFTIKPVVITVDWSATGATNFTYIYNAQNRIPAAATSGNSLTSIISGDSVPIKVEVNGSTAGMKNVGNYTAVASTTNTNYTIENSTQAFKIDPLKVSVVFTNTTLPYNAKDQKPTAQAPAAVDTLTIAVSVNDSTTGKKNVGKYTAVASIDNANYTLDATTIETEFVIEPKEITVEFVSNTLSLTYNGKAQTPSIKFVGVESGDDVLQSITVNGDSAINVGGYSATVKVSNPNYKLTGTVSTDFTIIQREITPVFTNTSLVYNGGAQKPTVSFQNTVTDIDPVVTIKVNGDTAGQINVGNYTATIEIANTNYKLVSNSTSFAITKKQISATFTNTTVTYNGENRKPTVSFTGVIGGDDVIPTVKVNDNIDGVKKAGDYTATVSIANSNYELKADTATRAFTISKAPLTLTWTNLEFTYDGTAKKPTATISSDTYDTLVITVTGAKTNANTDTDYYADATVDNDNYTITNPRQKFTIKPIVITVDWSAAGATDFAYIYNAQNRIPSAAVSSTSHIISGDSVRINVVVDGATAGVKNVGNYTATASSTDTNYTIENATQGFKINPLEVAVTFSNTTVIYNGQAQMPTATISGTPDQLTVTVKINNSTTGPKNAGTYTAVASITNANYTLKADTRETTFVISPKEITATFTNTTPTYNGQVQKPGVTFTGLVNGENANATVAITNGNGIDAGTHTATVTIANQNYKLTGTTSTNFTIAKKVITASFGNTTVTYNGQAQKPTVTFDNTVSGKAPQYTLKVGNSTAQTNAGTYTATVTLSETGNYTFANGLLTASTTFTVTAAQK